MDLNAAVEAFLPGFLTGSSTDLPKYFLPLLAEAAAPHAIRQVKQALVSPDADQLIAAIDLCERLIHAIPTDNPNQAAMLSTLGIALQGRFESTGDQTALDEAITTGRAAVEATPTDHPNQAVHLVNLGAALAVRFERSGALDDMDEAIERLRAAVEATSTDHPDRGTTLSKLMGTLTMRFKHSEDLADLDEAITTGRAVLQATPTDHPDQAGRLSVTGAALHIRFERSGNLADLDEAITIGRAAVEATPTDHPDRARMLSNLGTALRDRFRRSGDPVDLDQAIDRLQTALQATPTDHPDRARMLSNLGTALRDRSEWSGDLADADEALDRLQTALQATSTDHPARATMVADLGNALWARFRRSGDPVDLDQAIDRLQTALQATPTDHPDRARMLSNLGTALRDRFEQSGDLADLDQAITAGRAALQTTPTDHPDRAAMLNNLGGALRARFEQSGDLADLDQALDWLQTALQATPIDHPHQARHLSALGIALHIRFERSRDLADLDEAITAGRAALEAAPTDHPDRARMLSNLGAYLRAWFEQSGDLADLDQAITAGRAALQATPTDHPARAAMLNNLGASLSARFEQSGDLADLDQALDWLQTALRATPTDHPDRARVLSNLGGALRDRFERSGDLADLEAAVSAGERALEVVSAAPSSRIQTAWVTARLVAGSDAGRAADTAEAAVRLLPQVTPRQLGRRDQQYALSLCAGLAGDAAALALADPRGTQQERATRALRLLEAGRAVILSHALDVRSDLADLSQRRPDLATRFVQLRDQLDQPTDIATATVSEDLDVAAVRQERTVRDRHGLARDFANILAEIRALEGFASFALPPTTEELLTEAEQGPVVVFNVSRYRSDALLLIHDGITHLELPQLAEDALIEQVNTFHQALHATAWGDSREQRRQAQDVVTGVLQWLWDAAAGPVLKALGHHRQPSTDGHWPRVWWALGGLLGLLPLHAAGHHTDPADDPHRRTVMDRVISSHTPTIRALRHARQHAHRETLALDAPAHGLVVAMPTTPGLPDHGRLNHVGAEAEMLRRHLPRTVLLCEPDQAGPDSLSPTTPTKAAVLNHLPDCAIAHFACHGASHPTDPSQSQLLLHDHESDPLTVASLAPVQLEHARLAYLSACRTAAIDTANLIDEAIHLTSAFQLAGFPHVVGTLWEIDDQTAVTVADTFYTHLRTPDGTIDTGRSAWALHQAVRGLRDGHDLPAQLDRTKVPFLWAAYLHAGA
ncbi:tetratricopeptide repeat protein [Streptomyces sp. B6B3]|uniref:CHAT domain-containing tetratricopeptide repeat protein n=1 Tax=Streptomyces sp. B6B3 TaxID=3153570 RepID=UPI00325E9FE8